MFNDSKIAGENLDRETQYHGLIVKKMIWKKKIDLGDVKRNI